MRRGLLAEFASPQALTQALTALYHMGYRHLDAYTPFPITAIEPLLPPIRRHLLTLPTLIAGLVGAISAYTIQWWTNAVSYPLNVASMPTHSGLAYVPIVFETTVLFAGITTFVVLLIHLGLPWLWDPLFEVQGFERASVDAFFAFISADDPRFDVDRTRAHLDSLHPMRVSPVGVTP
jgi:hypothetical protein